MKKINDFNNFEKFKKMFENKIDILSNQEKTILTLNSIANSFKTKNNEIPNYLINDCNINNKSIKWLNDKLNINLKIKNKTPKF